MLRGEPGIGKTALLEYAIRSASDLTVIAVAGMESERELPYAALHQLCAPILDRLDRLPGPQRNALAITFGLSRGPAPDRFIVGLAILSLLSEAAHERPLVCVVDDARWLDRASREVLGFVARRLSAESVAMLFGARHPGEELRGLPELTIRGLRDSDARQLLNSVLNSPFDERIREQILAETEGNPLALLELPRGLSPTQLAGGFGLPWAPCRSRAGSRRTSYRGLRLCPRTRSGCCCSQPRSRAVIPDSSCGPRSGSGSPTPGSGPPEERDCWRSVPAFGFGIHSSARRSTAPRPRKRVARCIERWRRRPLPRSILIDVRGISPKPRRARTRTSQSSSSGRPAGPRRVEGSPLRRRSSISAAKLTTEPARRGHRALAAAQAKLQSGAPDEALAQIAAAEAGLHDELALAHVGLLRAQAAFATRPGSDTPPLLLQAAKQLETVDVALARDTYLEAISAAQFAGPLARGTGPRAAAAAARTAPRPTGPARPTDLLLDGLTAWLTEGCAAGAPLVKRALIAFRSEDIPDEDALRWLALASRIAGDGPWDHDTWEALVSRHVRLCREAGALSLLPIALTARVHVHLFAGELSAAAALSEELRSVVEATRSELAPYAALGVAAWQGREADTLALIDATTDEVIPRGEGSGLTATHWAAAVLYNGLARYEDALVAAKQASRPPEAMGYAHWSLVELVEAATRAGERRVAAEALDALATTTRPSGTDWAVGIESRSRALLSDGAEAERLYVEAIARLDRAGIRAELARAHLLYGEWLRRERRRLDARQAVADRPRDVQHDGRGGLRGACRT